MIEGLESEPVIDVNELTLGLKDKIKIGENYLYY